MPVIQKNIIDDVVIRTAGCVSRRKIIYLFKKVIDEMQRGALRLPSGQDIGKSIVDIMEDRILENEYNYYVRATLMEGDWQTEANLPESCDDEWFSKFIVNYHDKHSLPGFVENQLPGLVQYRKRKSKKDALLEQLNRS